MKAVLVFIDGTICDIRPQLHLLGTPEFYEREAILKALAVPGSVQCLQELAQRHQIVYIGARPASALPYTVIPGTQYLIIPFRGPFRTGFALSEEAAETLFERLNKLGIAQRAACTAM